MSTEKGPEKRGRGAPKGNKNALGNRGGPGGPPKNDKAVTHGFFRKILPDDPETREIFEATANMSTLEMLLFQIRIAWTNIMRAQKIQFVRDSDDMVKELRKKKTTFFGGENGGSADETEWEIQFAWDRQATLLTSQSIAMGNLTRMIKQYEEMLRALPPEEVKEEQRLQIQQIKGQIAVLERKAAGAGDEPIEILIKRKGDSNGG
ncbi:phage terminase small subunit [Paenibacillus ehimensis]|uniref:phage terminase small subunit n=1 Tax=Paenibacillus ehimensis TaxID=79264 RepID=UPI003D2842F2